MPRGDDNTDVLLYAGVGAIAAGLAWAFWPRTADAPSLHSYAPAPTEAPVTMPAFLAVAPPAGAVRERYFEAAVDAPTFVRIPLGQGVEVAVATDYLTAQGVRVPLWPSTAQRVADRFGAMLPTKRLVDAIWRAAVVKVAPRSMTPRPDASRDSNKLLAEHEALVNAAIAGRTGLTDGDKKSIIVGRSIPTTPGKVFIYGWHSLAGVPVQPVYGGHSARYADYSHGIRLVSRTAYVNGVPTPIETLFASPQYAPLLNESGTLTPAMLRYPTS
jgi:hypothetical protein